jgi:hypothetical protein
MFRERFDWERFENVLIENVFWTFSELFVILLRPFCARFRNVLWIFSERFVNPFRTFRESFQNVLMLCKRLIKFWWTFCKDSANFFIWMFCKRLQGAYFMHRWQDLSNDTSHDGVMDLKLMTFDRWPWRDRPISLKNQLELCKDPLCRMPKTAFENIDALKRYVCSDRRTDGQTDRQTDLSFP